MPAGVTWGQYLAFSAAAMLAMLTGSQMVHRHYRPLQDLNVFIEKELNDFPEHVKVKIRQELQDEGVLK